MSMKSSILNNENNHEIQRTGYHHKKSHGRDVLFSITHKIPKTHHPGHTNQKQISTQKHSPYSKNSKLKMRNELDENVRFRRDLHPGKELKSSDNSISLSPVLHTTQSQNIREPSHSSASSTPTSSHPAINNTSQIVTKVTNSSTVQVNNGTFLRPDSYRSFRTNFR